MTSTANSQHIMQKNRYFSFSTGFILSLIICCHIVSERSLDAKNRPLNLNPWQGTLFFLENNTPDLQGGYWRTRIVDDYSRLAPIRLEEYVKENTRNNMLIMERKAMRANRLVTIRPAKTSIKLLDFSLISMHVFYKKPSLYNVRNNILGFDHLCSKDDLMRVKEWINVYCGHLLVSTKHDIIDQY